MVGSAIVVGENVFAYRQRGLKPLDAAIRGAREMAQPVFLAVGTTVVAFLPLVYSEGTWGQILRVIPIVVISVLILSLIEALLILPSHLSSGKTVGGHGGPIAKVQSGFRHLLEWVIEHAYRPALAVAIRWRYATFAGAMGVLLLTAGYVLGGFVGNIFFPDVEADNMVAALEMPRGTPAERTEQIMRDIETGSLTVHTKTDSPSSWARRLAMVLLPAPAGPSMAMIIVSAPLRSSRAPAAPPPPRPILA